MIDIKELRSMVNGAQFESFANSVINSLLDRLEAAEKELESWKELAKQFGNEADALCAKIEERGKQHWHRHRPNVEENEMIDSNELRRLAQGATPGPWYVTGKRTRYVDARIDGGLIQEVAACGPTKADGGYGPQQEANARLIAAAPDLLDELLSILDWAVTERAPLRNQEIESIRKVIAKATGEHP